MSHNSKDMRDKMKRRYEDDPEVDHKHNKNHMKNRKHEPSHGHHLHGGKSAAHKDTHHHHRTTHHPLRSKQSRADTDNDTDDA